MCSRNPPCVLTPSAHYPPIIWDDRALGKKAASQPMTGRIWAERLFWDSLADPRAQLGLYLHEKGHLEGAECEDCADKRAGQIMAELGFNVEDARPAVEMFLTRIEHRSAGDAAKNFEEGFLGVRGESPADAAACPGSVDGAGLCKATGAIHKSRKIEAADGPMFECGDWLPSFGADSTSLASAISAAVPRAAPYASIIVELANKYAPNDAERFAWLHTSVIQTESNFNPLATNPPGASPETHPRGAFGLGQISKRFHEDFFANDSQAWKYPQANLDRSAQVLAGGLKAFAKLGPNESIRPGVASYNAGVGGVRQALDAGNDPDSACEGWNNDPPLPYSRTIVDRVAKWTGKNAQDSSAWSTGAMAPAVSTESSPDSTVAIQAPDASPTESEEDDSASKTWTIIAVVFVLVLIYGLVRRSAPSLQYQGL